MIKIRTFISAISILIFTSINAAEKNCQQVTENIEGLIISEIKILNENIFDLNKSDENAAIHRLANKLHWKTRAATIRQQLLIHQGQQYSQNLIDEAERKLREKRYLHSVSIYPEKICNNKVIVIVKTSDNWTLTPSISFGRSGGINRSSFSISESNLFGLGKNIELKSESNEDRKSQFVKYVDDSLLGSRSKLSLKKANNSDGYLDSIVIGKPFFQLDSKQSLLLDASREKKQIATYDKGQIIDITGQLSESHNLEYGWSSGLQNKHVSRYKIGWDTIDKQYFNVQDFPDTVLPLDKNIRYPYLGFEYLEDKYIQRKNFNVMAVIEDISIGKQFSLKAGILSQSLGSTHDGFKLTGNYLAGLEISANSLVFIDLSLNSEINRDAEDLNSISLKSRFLNYQDNNHSYFLKAEFQVADNLLPIDQYVIGGDTGLRGYPIRFQTGSRKALLSAEKRTYFNWYPGKLVKFGLAFFADTGSAWDKNQSPNFITDVGIGIRLVATRQSDSKVLHIDFAYPLDEQDNVDNFQLLLKAKSQF